MLDVIIIGGGVSGCSIARELSRYQVQAAVLEKAEDVCCGTSKANSGIVHSGYDAIPGSLMAKLNVKGNKKMEELSKELDFSFKRTGSLTICTRQEDIPRLKELYERGVENGVEGLKILTRQEAFAMEKNLSEETAAALYAPSAGIVCPFGLTIAMAENAYANGIKFYFNTEAQKIEKQESHNEVCYRIKTSQGDFQARYVVNAAGVYSDTFHNMVSGKKIKIVARKGEYMLLDKSVGKHVQHTVFALPGKFGKGVLVTPTVHGNLLVGPNANEIQDKEGIFTTMEGLAEIREKSAESVKNIPFGKVITSFAGLRASEAGHDFIIKEAEDAKGFIDCAGIESPGLTSAPAIGEMVADMLKSRMNLKEKPEFISKRKGILNPALLSLEERNALISQNPAYGNIICRCEMISEGEILDAIRRPLGAKSLDGVKRRTRAGMGRCQAGFCSPKTMELLHRELGIPMEKLTKSGDKSWLVYGRN